MRLSQELTQNADLSYNSELTPSHFYHLDLKEQIFQDSQNSQALSNC